MVDDSIIFPEVNDPALKLLELPPESIESHVEKLATDSFQDFAKTLITAQPN